MNRLATMLGLAPNPAYGPVRASRAGSPVLWIQPPKAAMKIAREALDRQEGIPKSRRGGWSKAKADAAGITSGCERAKSIARGDLQPAQDIRDFFSRFSGTYLDAELSGKAWEDSKVMQSWDLWGGTPMWQAAYEGLKREGLKPGREPNPSTLEAVYDGYRRKKHMVTILPGSSWGQRAYGLSASDDFRFDPPRPSAGQRVLLHLADSTYSRLLRQRNVRARHRRRR